MPRPEPYRARAEELTPDDAPPELRARIAQLADGAHRRATKQWQHDRNQAGLAAIDWLVAHPGAPVATMDRTVASQLAPNQLLRLQEIETNGRLDTDPDIYEQLDRQAVYDPKGFAGADVDKYRLVLHGEDYRRFHSFQTAMREGKPDPALERYARGRTVLDHALHRAGFDPDGSEARAARAELDKTLRSFEAIEARSPAMKDIDRVAEMIFGTGQAARNQPAESPASSRQGTCSPSLLTFSRPQAEPGAAGPSTERS